MDSHERDLDYFLARFTELADDAKKHGLSVAILIENDDPISQTSGFFSIYRGSPITILGLVHRAQIEVEGKWRVG